jgi:uncharacterized Zn-binding protein involved in type VI secretion
MPYILNTQSSAQCTHGGTVQFSTSNTLMKVDQAYALLQTDVHTVSGCPFTTPAGTPSPCLTVTWITGASQTKVNQVPVLLQNSTGLCIGPSGPQGTVTIGSVQSLVEGT